MGFLHLRSRKSTVLPSRRGHFRAWVMAGLPQVWAWEGRPWQIAYSAVASSPITGLVPWQDHQSLFEVTSLNVWGDRVKCVAVLCTPAFAGVAGAEGLRLQCQWRAAWSLDVVVPVHMQTAGILLWETNEQTIFNVN